MAENRNLHVQLTVSADTKQAQAEFANLISSLQKIQTIPKINFDDSALKNASKSAQELESHLQAAFNVNTGKLDLSQFSASLSKSDKQLEDYYKDLIAIGDQGQKAFLQVAQSIASADAPLKNANSKLNEFLGTLKNTARWQISSSLLHGFMGSLQSAYSYAQNLNESLNSIQIVTNKSNDEMAKFAETANKAATALNTTTLKYSDASLIYFQQGLSAEEVEKRTAVTVKMAHASGQAVQEVSQQLTSVWNNFAEGSENLEYYADVMTALGAATASSSTEIAKGLQKFSSIGKTVGLSYEYAASALATITATTRESAETVGNALKSLFARIQSLKLGETLEDGVDLNKYAAAIEKVGVHVLTANGELRDMDDILDDLMGRWEELDRAQQTALAQTVAGQRQYAQFMTLMNQGDFFKQNVEVANNSEGTVEQQAEIWEKSWAAAKERVQQSLNDIYEKLVDDNFFINLSDALDVIIKRVSDLVDGFGGVYGILGTIGSIFAQKFASQVPQFLDNLNQKLLIATGTAREMAVELQQKNAMQMESLVATDRSGTENSLELQTQKIQQISQMKSQLIQKEKELSEAERQSYELEIRKVEATYDNIDAYAKELDTINKELRTLEQTAISQGTRKSAFINREDVQNGINEMQDYCERLQNVVSAQNQIGEQASIWQKQNTSVEEIREKTKQWLDELEKSGKIDLNTTNTALSTLRQHLENGTGTQKELLDLMRQIGSEGSEAFLSAGSSANQLQEEINLSRMSLKEMGVSEDILDRLENGFRQSADGANKLNNAYKLIQQEGAKAFDHQTHFSEALMKTVGTLSQFSAVINSVQRFSDVLTDKDASVVSKLTAAIGLLTTAMMFASSAAGTLDAWKKFNTASSIAQAAAESTLTGATGTLTVAMNALKASFLTNPLFLAGAAIIATIIGITSAIQAETKAREEHIESLKEEASALDEEYQKQQEEFKSKEDLIQNYKDALKVYKDTGEGKAALISAAQAAAEAYDIENSNILILNESYDKLTKSIYAARDADLDRMRRTAGREKSVQEEIIMNSMEGEAYDTAVKHGKTSYIFTDNIGANNWDDAQNLLQHSIDEAYTVRSLITGAGEISQDLIDACDQYEGEYQDSVDRIIDMYKTGESAVFETAEEAEQFRSDMVNMARAMQEDTGLSSALEDLYKTQDFFLQFGNEASYSIAEVVSEVGEDVGEALADTFRFSDNFSGRQEEFTAEAEKAIGVVEAAWKEAGKEASIRMSSEKGSNGDIFIDAFSRTGEGYYDVYQQALQWKEAFEDQFEDNSYTEYKLWQEVDTWLTEHDEIFKGYQEVIDKYKDLDLLINTDNIEDSFVAGLDDKKINTTKEYTAFIDKLRQELEEMGLQESEISQIIDTRYGKYGKYAELALKVQAAEDKRANASSQKEKDRIDSLEEWLTKHNRTDDLQFFGYIDFNENKSDEEFAKEIDRLKEKAEHDELKLQVKTQVAAANNLDFKSGMNRNELLDFKESSGIEWDTEINGVIIKWEDFLAASDAKRKEMLESWAKDTLDSDKKILDEDLEYAKANVEEKEKILEEKQNIYEDLKSKNFQYDENKSEVENQREEQRFIKENQQAKEAAAEAVNQAEQELSDANDERASLESERHEQYLLELAEIKSAVLDMKDISYNSGDILDKDTTKALTQGLHLDLSDFTIDGGHGQLVVQDPEGLNQAMKKALIQGVAHGSIELPMQDLISNFDELYMIPEGWIQNNKELYKIITDNVVKQGEWTKDVKDFDSLMTHVISGEMDFAEGWKQAGSNIKEMSLDEFNEGLKQFTEDQSEEKAKYIAEAIGKINDIADQTPSKLKDLRDELGENSEEWEKIQKQVDLTGKSFDEIREYKDILDPETLAKYNKEALETETNLDEIIEALKEGDISSTDFSKRIQELLNNGDITLQEALSAIYEGLSTGELKADEASAAIDACLNKTETSTEERIEALRDKIRRGISEASDLDKLLKEILNNDDMGLDQKNAALDAQHDVYFSGGGMGQAYDLTNDQRREGKLSLAEDEFASLAQKKQFLDEYLAALEQGKATAQVSIGELESEGIRFCEIIASMGEAGSEYAPDIFKIFGLDENGESKNLPDDQLMALGQGLLSVYGDAENGLQTVQAGLDQYGLTLDDIGLKTDDFKAKTEQAYEYEDLADFATNLQNLNDAYRDTDDVEKYIESLSELIEKSDDLGLNTEQARSAILATSISVAQGSGELRKYATQITGNCKNLGELKQVLSVIKEARDDEGNAILTNAEYTRLEVKAYSQQASQYKSCEKALNAYKKAMASGNEEAKKAAKSELDLRIACAQTAQQYEVSEEMVQAVAQSFKELVEAEAAAQEVEVDSDELAASLAERYVQVNEGVKDLQQNYESYTETLNALNEAYQNGGGEAYNAVLFDQGENVNKLRDAVANALGVQDETLISNDLLASSYEDIKGVMEGDIDAYERLQEAMAEDLIMHIDVDDQTFLDKIGATREQTIEAINSIPPGVIDLDTAPFIQSLATLLEECGMTGEEIKEFFKGLGIEIDYSYPMQQTSEFAENVEDTVDQAMQNVENNVDQTGANVANATDQHGAETENATANHSNGVIGKIVNLGNNVVSTIAEAATEMNKVWAEGQDNLAENTATMSIDEQNVTDEENKEEVGWIATPTPVPYSVQVPEYSISTSSSGVAVTSRINTLNMQYADLHVKPDKQTAKTKKETKLKGIHVDGATKSGGGIVSGRNIGGGNRPSSSSGGGGGGGGGSNGGRTSQFNAPSVDGGRVVTVREETHGGKTHDTDTWGEKPEYQTREVKRDTHDRETHDQKTPDRLYLDDYLKDDPKKEIVKLQQQLDEIYTTRKKFYNERYAKDKEVDEKEYQTKDSSIFKRASEEIEQYHDINNTLEKISYKLQEIDQRKSRAFGKAHIDAINEEKSALQEQLQAQTEYLSQMADRRAELQKQMKAQGWEFDDNGSIANYVDKKMMDIEKYNQGAEQFIDQANINAATWNEAAHQVTDNFNAMQREATDIYNESMQQLTTDTNNQYAQIDAIANASNQVAVNALNNARTMAADQKYISQLSATSTYNNTISAGLDEYNAGMAEQEELYDRLMTDEEEKRDTLLTAVEDKKYARQLAIEEAKRQEYERINNKYDTQRSAAAGDRNAAQRAWETNSAALGRKVQNGTANYEEAMVYAENWREQQLTAAEQKKLKADEAAKAAYENKVNSAKAEYDAIASQYDGNSYTSEEKQRIQEIVNEAKEKFENIKKEAERELTIANNEASETFRKSENTIQNTYESITSKARDDLRVTKQKIDDEYAREKAEADAKYSNDMAKINNESEAETKRINNDFKNNTKRIENDFKLNTQAIKTKFDNQQTTAEANLRRANAQAEETYDNIMNESDFEYNAAISQIKRLHESGKRLIDESYDDQSHGIKEIMQDMQDAADSYYEEGMKQADKAYAEMERINELNREGYEYIYEENEKMRQEYEQLEDTMDQAMMDAQELRNKIYDNAVEVIDYTLNLKVRLSEEVVAALNALLDAIGDNADRAADKISVLGSKMSQFANQVGYTRDAIYDLINSTSDVDQNVMNRIMQGTFTTDDLAHLFNTDEFTEDKTAKLEAYRDSIVSLISEQRTLKEEMFGTIESAFSEYTENIDKQIEKITNLTAVTTTYKNILGIVGKKVLDFNGDLSETLAISNFKMQQDQTHALKEELNMIDRQIGDMEQQRNKFAVDSEMYKDWQKQIDAMEEKRQEVQQNWLSSWEAEMQAAVDYYANAIDTIIMHFDKGISGLMGSLELLNKEYGRQQQISSIYVEDYEKIYQLNKLNRDIEAALDDSDRIKNKSKLKKLQEEINQANQDGVKLSQYDLDVLRKKFELELAREELEDSKNAKSQVRLTRDNEGNYGYIYTADADSVAKAEQNYEDKLHELQVLNSEYIKQLESNYMQLQQNVRDEIASLDITQFETEEDYLAEVDRIQKAALELQERYGQQFGNAFENNSSLYENEWRAYSEMTGYKISADEDYLDKFTETTYAVLTGFQTMAEAKDAFTNGLTDAIAAAVAAYETTAGMQEQAMVDGNTSMEKFARDAISTTEELTEESSELADEANTLADSYETAFSDIVDAAGDFADNYVAKIQPVIDENLRLLDTIAQIIEYQANLNGMSGNGSGSGGQVSGVGTSGTANSWDAFATGKDQYGGLNSNIGNYLTQLAAVIKYAGYENDFGGWGTGEERNRRLVEVFGEGADKDFQKYWNEYAATGEAAAIWSSLASGAWQNYSYNTLRKMKFDTGGYTGNWNSLEGRLALLHEKELVLNQEDTSNILATVGMIREISRAIDLNALSASSIMGSLFNAPAVPNNTESIMQQEVHITAEFPNATDRDEIIDAFDNLINLASQYAGKM